MGKLLNSADDLDRFDLHGLMWEEGQEDGCIWLAGHSLGAAVAQVVGRCMMEREEPLNLPAFLFNPPYVAFITSIKLLNFLKADPVAKRHFYFASSLLKAAAGLVLVSHRKRREKSFKRVSAWVPNLYMHEDDWICRGFIGYFEAREEFKESLTRVGIWFKDHFGGRDKFKKFFTRVGIWSMALSHCDVLSWALLGKDKERPHLLPSVTLWKSRFDPECAHDLRHWWKPDSELKLGAGTSYSCPVHEVQTTSSSMLASSTPWASFAS
ncbi:hypothetical protein CFC21_067757 [Triticum aestivum]|uniref:Fungal lipase-like domain-containing protein n=2 Tax=Triticum aestivum TaxID=4565 RepID=A0A3B6KQE9_WHEAT|nr:hypothetical protein CFC21_067757 [Triticum aestivum]